MVDAADEAKFTEAKEELHQLMAKPQLANIPLLVLGNKNDLPEAVKDEETLKQLLYVVIGFNLANMLFLSFCSPFQRRVLVPFSCRPFLPSIRYSCTNASIISFINASFSDLESIQGREVCLYSISAKNNVKIDVTLNWLIQHADQQQE